MNTLFKYWHHSRQIYNACVRVLGDMIKVRGTARAQKDKGIAYYSD